MQFPGRIYLYRTESMTTIRMGSFQYTAGRHHLPHGFEDALIKRQNMDILAKLRNDVRAWRISIVAQTPSLSLIR